MGIGNFKSSHSLSAGHVPLGLGRDSGIRLSNVGSIIIASSILRGVCFIVVF